jgi:hypothetical protein
MPGSFKPHYPPSIQTQLQDITNWEWITGDAAPDEDTFGTETASAEMQGYLHDHALLHDALAYFLGYSYVDPADTTTYLLKRNLPSFHPRWPWLHCVRVGIKAGTERVNQDYLIILIVQRIKVRLPNTLSAVSSVTSQTSLKLSRMAFHFFPFGRPRFGCSGAGKAASTGTLSM